MTALLALGVKPKEIAGRFGIGEQSIRRHRRNGHMVAPPAPATTAPSASSLGTESTPEELIRAIVLSLQTQDISKLPVNQQMQVIRERRLSAEALAKATPARLEQEGPKAREAATLTEILRCTDEAIDAMTDDLARRSLEDDIARRIKEWKAIKNGTAEEEA